MRADGTEQQQLTTSPEEDFGIQWSPNGQVFAFVSERDGNLEIYRMRTDGSEQQRLTTNPGSDTWPQWSPDGQWIAFVSDRDGNEDIYRMRADGSEQQPLTITSKFQWSYEWSPPLHHRVWHPWRLLGICGSLGAVVLVPKSKTLMRRRGK
jgi:TolB protein